MKKETTILLKAAKGAALSSGKFATIVALAAFSVAIAIAGFEDFKAGGIRK